MSYVKITGTNIGNCLTGFGIHFPITVFNSGNAQVSYSIENSNDTNFSISKSSFVINPDSFDLWTLWTTIPTASPSDIASAKAQLKRLDPFNPDLK